MENQTEPTASFAVDGEMYAGTVVNMANSAITVAFESSSVRGLSLPLEVKVGIQAEHLPNELSGKGSIRHWCRDGDRDCLRIDIKDEQFAILESAAFPQRSARTAVRGSKAIRVSVKPLVGEAEISAAMVDISDSGLAVILMTKDDLSLAASACGVTDKDPWLLRLRLQLPGNESELQFVGELCYRMFTRKCIKYGIQFDKDATQAAFPDAPDSIQEHIDKFRESLGKSAA